MMHPVRLLIVLTIIAVSKGEAVILHTAQGRLRGVQREGYVSYQSIPYGSINGEGTKFKMASLAPTWANIRESVSNKCSPTSEVEECLNLDVHVPETVTSPRPVLVWIRGGSGNYSPGNLVRQGIILVIVNHRLGTLGFICSRTEQNPGNAGVKDAVLALRWIRDNIVAFKGNPDRVIVAGQGFGAAMVEVLTFSPMSRGLFHGAILQSGTSLSPSAFNYDAEERAITLLRKLTQNNDFKSRLLTTNSSKMVTEAEQLELPYFPFGMCIEKSFKNEELILSEPPYKLLQRVNLEVPIIIGYNSDEAYIFLENLIQPDVMRRISRDLTTMIPAELKFLNERELNQVVKQINETYFLENISLSTILAFHRDAYFVSHIYRSVRLHGLFSHFPIYFYQFSYSGTAGVEPVVGIKKQGAAHSDELAYLFSNEDKQLRGDDAIVQTHFLQLWSNFVKYLNPTGEPGEVTHWEATTQGKPRLLSISTDLKMKDFPYDTAATMWDKINEKYYYNRQEGFFV